MYFVVRGVKKNVYLVEERVVAAVVVLVDGGKYLVTVWGVADKEHDTWFAKLHFLRFWSNKNPDGHEWMVIYRFEHE